MSLSLDDIRSFIVVAKTKNITRASEILGTTQPSLSYAIKRLELELGDELLVRFKNGVQLSQIGEKFLEQAGKLLFEWEQAQKIVVEHRNHISGQYTIGMHPSVALYSLQSFLPKLTKKYPLLTFDFYHGLSREITEKIVSWEIDIGLVINPKPHPDLVIKKLGEDLVTIFGLKESKDCIIYDPDLIQTNLILKKVAQDNYEKSYRSSNLEVIAKLAALGEGDAILPTRVAQHYKKLLPRKNAPTVKDTICLIYRVDKQKSKGAKAIIKAITEADI